MPRGLIGLLTLLTVACGPATAAHRSVEEGVAPDTANREFLSLVPVIVDAIAPRTGSGTLLLLDLNSFVSAGRTVSGTALNLNAVERVVGREFRNTESGAAVVRVSEYRYEVRDGGVHVRLDSIARVGDGYEAFVTYRYTETRGAVSAIGMRHVMLAIVKSGGRWQVQRERVLSTT